MWYPDKSAFRAGYVASTYWNTDSIGNHSMALGNNAKARADISVALGNNTTATGYASTAMGSITTASGTAATSMGIQTRAAAHYSTAMGYYTTAVSAHETVIGSYNTLYTPVSTTSWNVNDRLFVIGKGTNDGARSNAMTVMKNGDVGIGTDTPDALLHTDGTGAGQGNVLFTGQFKDSNPGATPVTGEGTRMMWYPDKAALRAGRVIGTYWNTDSIGNYSVAFGYNTRARGNNSVAAGSDTRASGFASTALGSVTKATGTCATALGIGTQANGSFSTAMGSYTTAPSGYETVIGNYNTTYSPASTTSWNNADRLFVIGNGTGTSARSNAMTVMKNGKVGVGTDTPEATLDVDGAIGLGDAGESPQAGMVRWNSTNEDFEGYDGSKWISLTRANSGTWGVVAPFLVSENQKATSADGDGGDAFGCSVSLSGDYAIVGAREHDAGGSTNKGAAYIFLRSVGTWAQQTKLVASDGAAEDYFGWSVSISGDYAIVGAPEHDPGGIPSQGAAYIFHRTGTTWTQQAKLTASDGVTLDRFGYTVDITVDYAIIGAPYHNISGNLDQGAAYIFLRSGTSWAQLAKLTASDGEEDDCFGFRVAMTGDFALIGAPFDNIGGYFAQGSAYMFQRSGMSWIEQVKLTPNWYSANCYYGCSVDISGDMAIIGASGHDNGKGAAYTYKNNGSSWDGTGSLTANDGLEDDSFGVSVSITSEYAVVGAAYHEMYYLSEGAVYIFRNDDYIWYPQSKLIASDCGYNDTFGYSLSFDNDFIIVGAYYDDIGANYTQGSVYFFNK